MTKIKWDPSLDLGIGQIDDQHRQLVDICNEFIMAVKSGQTDEVIQETIIRLREYTVRHFYDEEQYLESIRYPRRKDQQSAHVNLVKQVKQYQRDIYKRRDITPEAIRDFLRSWLIDHILDMDLDIAKWVREQEHIEAEKQKQCKVKGDKNEEVADGTA